MATSTCPICCDARLTPAASVACGVCEHVCCKTCVKKFLLDSMDDPQCMACRRRFTHADLVDKLPRAFVDGDLKRHRERVLLDRQKAMIPSTQDAVLEERSRRRSLKRIRELTEQRDRLKRQMQTIAQQIGDEHREMATSTATGERRQFVMRCSVDNCQGFLTEQYKCTVCESSTCPQCHVVIRGTAAEHVCNPDDVATVTLLRHDSKRCPSCATWIHRYEGCTQMFCTNPACHALFDYRTLRLLGTRDHVHNPHYTEWLARQRGQGSAAREAGDIPCGGMPHVNELHRALVPRFGPSLMPGFLNRTSTEVQRILHTHRMVIHTEHQTLPRYRTNVDDPDLAYMRVQFCLGDFGEQTWRTRLQRREKERTKRDEIALVLEMVIHACSDLFRQMVLTARGEGASARSVEEVHADVYSVLKHANAALCHLSTTFNCIVPQFDLEAQRVVTLSPGAVRTAIANAG